MNMARGYGLVSHKILDPWGIRSLLQVWKNSIEGLVRDYCLMSDRDWNSIGTNYPASDVNHIRVLLL